MLRPSTSIALLLGLAVSAAAVAEFGEDPVGLNFNITERMKKKKKKCGSFCKFRLCKVDGFDSLAPVGRRIQLRDPRIAIPPFVCRKDIRLGTVLQTGQALVGPRKGGKLRRISKFNPSGLSDRFPKDYFDLFQINFPPLPRGKVGIGRRGTIGNQDDFAGDLCGVIPIKKYTIVNKKGKVVKTVSKTGKKDCVSFTTTTTKLLIEFTWLSPDDLDIVVEEPDGTIISKDMLRSPSGGALNGNNNKDGCASLEVGKEQVSYKKDTKPQFGTYKVTLIHRGNCGKKATDWSLYVISEGSLIDGTIGTSNKNNGAVIGTFQFELEEESK